MNARLIIQRLAIAMFIGFALLFLKTLLTQDNVISDSAFENSGAAAPIKTWINSNYSFPKAQFKTGRRATFNLPTGSVTSNPAAPQAKIAEFKTIPKSAIKTPAAKTTAKKEETEEKSPDAPSAQTDKVANTNHNEKSSPRNYNPQSGSGQSYVYNAYNPNQTNTNKDNTANDQEEEKGYSYEEWKEKLLNNPSLKTIAELLEHYTAKKLSKSNFYALVSLMLESSDKITKDLALKSLGATPSIESFSLLTHYSIKETDETLRTLINKNVDAYTIDTKLNILAQALSLEDKVVVIKAASLIEKCIARASKIAALDIELGKDPNVTSIKYDFSRVIPLLELLVKEKDSEIGQSAETALNQIQSYQNT